MQLKTKRYKITIIISHIFSAIIASSTAALLNIFLSVPRNKLKIIIVSSIVLSYYFCFQFFTRKYRRRKKILNKPFPVEWEKILQTSVYYYTELPYNEKTRFKKQIQIFLNEKIITGIETEIDEKIKVLTAASAVIPVFNIPEWEYDKLNEILIYPRNFNENYGFSDKDEPILGMVISNTSTIILSKPALTQSFKKNNDSFNVGIHEFIHKVDGEDGIIDGIPALIMDNNTIEKYVAIADTESEKIKTGSSDINSYALTNRAEFFAVTSEYFFENPQKMNKEHPELYAVLKKIFRQDMVAIFRSAISSMFGKRKKIGRNSPCPCGSGKKYKKCCLNKNNN